MQPVRYGIIGVGGYGTARRKLLRQTGCFEIVGGVEIAPAAFDDADRAEGKALVRYPSVEVMVADPDIEALSVATPAHLHVEQAMLAARAGKAIFVEKPLGHDLAACTELVEFCERHNVPHGHGFGARYKPLWQYVKTMLDAGTLGPAGSFDRIHAETAPRTGRQRRRALQTRSLKAHHAPSM